MLNSFLMGQCPSGRSLLIYMFIWHLIRDMIWGRTAEPPPARKRKSVKAQKKGGLLWGDRPAGVARSERGERGEDIVCELLGAVAVQPEHDLHEIIAAFGNGGVGGVGFALEFLVGVVAEHHVAVDGGLGDLDALAVLF